MKALYHKTDLTYRVVYRRKLYIAQAKGPEQSSRTYDPWDDLHPGSDTLEQAEALMYSRKPVLKT